MPIGSGLSSQVGIGVEGSYGTFATPTRFLEFLSEGIAPDIPRLRTRSLGDQFVRQARTRAYIKGFAGPLELDFMTSGMGLLLKHALGSVATTGAGPYTHTFTPDAVGLQGLSMTVQVGKPSTDGTVHPFNYLGGKITEFMLDQQVDQNLKFRTTWDFANLSDIASALGTASYPATNTPLAFLDAAVTIDGSAATLRQVQITGKRALATDRRYLGNSKAEPIANGEYEFTGQLDREFIDTSLYAKFVSGATAALVMTHTYGAFTLTTTLPAIEYTGDNPAISGSDLVREQIPFKALKPSASPIITLVYTTSDSVP